jgi:hypothetical protein
MNLELCRTQRLYEQMQLLALLIRKMFIAYCIWGVVSPHAKELFACDMNKAKGTESWPNQYAMSWRRFSLSMSKYAAAF